jgi:hypothetical protein
MKDSLFFQFCIFLHQSYKKIFFNIGNNICLCCLRPDVPFCVKVQTYSGSEMRSQFFCMVGAEKYKIEIIMNLSI